MSQAIIKQQQGGKTPQSDEPILLDLGTMKVDQNDFIKRANEGLQDWLDYYYKNKGDKKWEEFNTIFADVISQIEQGKVHRNTGGQWEFENYDPRVEGETPKAVQHVINYLGTIANNSTEYKPQEEKKLKYTDATNLTGIINREYYGGNTPTDLKEWYNQDYDEKTKKYGYTNRVGKLLNYLDEYEQQFLDKNYDFTGTAFNNLEDFKTHLNVLRSNLANGNFDNTSRQGLLRLGMSESDLNNYFGEKYIKPTSTETNVSESENNSNNSSVSSEESYPNASKEGAEGMYDRQQKAADEYIYNLMHPEKLNELTISPSFKEELTKTFHGLGFYNFSPDFNFSIDSFIKKLFNPTTETYKNEEQVNALLANNIVPTATGLYFFNKEDPSQVLIYDINSGKSKLDYVYNVPEDVRDILYKMARNQYLQTHKSTEFLEYKKEGGILKQQSGGYIDYYNTYNKKENKSSQNNKDLEKIPESIELSAADKVRLGGLISDLTSVVTSIFPGQGTAISLGTGVAGSLTTLVGDLMEKGNTGKDLLNFAGNLGLDLVGLIPYVGSLSKLNSLVKPLMYFSSGISTAAALVNAPNIIASIEKLSNQGIKSLNENDWHNIIQGASLLAGGSNAIKNYNTTKKVNKASTQFTGNTYTLKTTEGNIALDNEEQYKALLGKNTEEALSLLKQWNIVPENFKGSIVGKKKGKSVIVSKQDFNNIEGTTSYDYSNTNTEGFNAYDKETLKILQRLSKQHKPTKTKQQNNNLNQQKTNTKNNPELSAGNAAIEDIYNTPIEIKPRVELNKGNSIIEDIYNTPIEKKSKTWEDLIDDVYTSGTVAGSQFKSTKQHYPAPMQTSLLKMEELLNKNTKFSNSSSTQIPLSRVKELLNKNIKFNPTYTQVPLPKMVELLNKSIRFKSQSKALSTTPSNQEKKVQKNVIKNIINSPVTPKVIYEKPYTPPSIDFNKIKGYYKEGGVVKKFQQGGVTDVTFPNYKNFWYDNIYNSKQYEDIIRNINSVNYTFYNDLQNRYYNLSKEPYAWQPQSKDQQQYLFKENLQYSPDVYYYQKDFNNFAGGINSLFNSNYTKAGNTGDNDPKYIDGYYGKITYNRHLGKDLQDDQLHKLNILLLKNNMQAYVDPNTGMVNFAPLGPIERPKSNDTITINPENLLSNISGNTSIPDKIDKNDFPNLVKPTYKISSTQQKEPFNWNQVGNGVLGAMPGILAELRLAGDIRKNKEIAQKAKDSLVPAYKSPINTHYVVSGDYMGEQLAKAQAADLINQGSKPITTDMNKQMSYLHDLYNTGIKHVYGAQQRSDAYVKDSIEKKQNIKNEEHKYNTGVNDYDVAIGADVSQKKGAIDTQMEISNRASIDARLKQIEKIMRNNVVPNMYKKEYFKLQQAMSSDPILNNLQLLMEQAAADNNLVLLNTLKEKYYNTYYQKYGKDLVNTLYHY